MTSFPRALASLEKLLNLARADANVKRIDLVDIEHAQLAAHASLNGLDETVRREEALVKETGAGHFAAYLEGVRERRLNLQTTVMTLNKAEQTTRAKLEAAFIDIKKLEHLIDINKRSVKKAAARKDIGAADSAFAARKRG